MNAQLRQVLAILLVLVMCPLLTVFHGSAWAGENGGEAQASQTWEHQRNEGNHSPDANKRDTAVKSLDVLIDHFSGLSGEQKAEMEKALGAELSDTFANNDWNEDLIIPLAGIIFAAFAVSIPVLIVFLVLVFAQRKRQQRMELISKFVENGQEVPKELLVSHSDADVGGKDTNMKSGILLMGVGVGVLVAVGLLASWKIGAIGLVPFFIGLARFIIWKLEDKLTAGERTVED